MRVFVDLVVAINAVGAIVGFTARTVLRRRRSRADEHIQQLEEENERYDRINERLTGGR